MLLGGLTDDVREFLLCLADEACPSPAPPRPCSLPPPCPAPEPPAVLAAAAQN